MAIFSKRRHPTWRSLAIILIAALLLFAGWRSFHTNETPTTPAQIAAATPTADWHMPPLSNSDTANLASGKTSVVARAGATAAPSVNTARSAVIEAEICGHGKLPLRDVANGFPGALAVPAVAALSGIFKRMAKAEGERDRALALLAQSYFATDFVTGLGSSQRPLCGVDPDCILRANSDLQAPFLTPLVGMASTTTDPAVYASALRACSQVKVKACDVLTPARWTHLDPDNGAAWIMTANWAEQSGDLPGWERALQRAAGAREFDLRALRLDQIVLREDFAALPAAVRATAMLPLMFPAQEDGLIALLAPAIRYCRSEATGLAVQREACGALADLLMNREKSLTALRAATWMGNNNFSEQKTAALEEEIDALAYAERLRRQNTGSLGCARVEQLPNDVRSMQSGGPTALLRKWLADRGETNTSAATKQRQYFKELMDAQSRDSLKK